MLTKLFSKIIRVKFIDNHTKQVFSFSDLQPEQLPESFALNTILTIENSKWSVVKAEPMESSEIRKTRNLKLYLNKIEMINPNNINYSLPTISSDVPMINNNSYITDKDLLIHLDDWRQIEFFSLENSQLVESEIDQIKFVKGHHQVKPFGYSNIHVRDKIKGLIYNNQLSMEQITHILNVDIQACFNIFIDNNKGAITNGFAFDYCDNTICGVADNGIIKILCLYRNNYVIDDYASLMKTFNLGLADWVATELFV